MVVRRTRDDGAGLGNEDNADDVFLALKDLVLGPWAWILVVAVLVSAVSSTQTTILPTARGTLAMAAYKALPAPVRRPCTRGIDTPSFSTLVMGIVAIVYYVGMTLISREHPRRLDPLARPGHRVLLRHHRFRLRLVLPQGPVPLGARLLLQGPVPAARRAHARLRVHPVAASTCTTSTTATRCSSASAARSSSVSGRSPSASSS